MDSSGAADTTGNTGLLPEQHDAYEGVIVDLGEEPVDVALFADRLRQSLQVATIVHRLSRSTQCKIFCSTLLSPHETFTSPHLH